jgi:CRP-like cAMP-binding protein/Fe-S-cluster-containing hydrogenase component 2
MQQSSIKPHTPHAIDQRIIALRQLDQLGHIPSSELRILAEQAVLRVFEPRTTIIVERSAAHCLFLSLSGQAEQSMRAADGTPITLALPGRGAVFGEGGLFGQRQRRTTVRSETRVCVLQWRYDNLEAQRHRLPQIFHLLEQIYREHLLYTTLAQVPQLALLHAEDRVAIAQQVREHRFERGAEIVQAGTDRAGVYIVAEGQVRVVYADQTVAVFGPGAVFGEMSFVDNTPHEATIVALTPVHVLEIPGPAFEQLLTDHAQVMHQLRALADERRASDRSPAHIAVTERLVDTGIVRGNMVLAKQVDLCDPGCQRCEDACAERYTVSRLHFSGAIFGALEVPDLCRHCQWGAECAESCPEDAFSITEQGYLVITDRCTGCGACITACPYEAINQVPTYPVPQNVLERVRFALQPPAATGFKANKCDACHGHSDHACVSACPTGALQWISLEELYRAAC